MELRGGNRKDRSSPCHDLLLLLQYHHHLPGSISSTENSLFNRNIIIAAVTSIIADAVVVNYAVQITSNSIVVSLVSMITDSGVYLATFAAMFLIDNKSKYIDSTTGKKDSTRFRRDVKKIITALGVSELVYMAVKFTSIYILLQSNIAPPYQIAMISTLLAWIVYIIIANAMVRWQKLFK
ncbi:MAG: hypothetical protein M3288_06685 [Thermoproteota archaeon]|nr:hypothetical protein [Thermoproteota archaeon]